MHRRADNTVSACLHLLLISEVLKIGCMTNEDLVYRLVTKPRKKVKILGSNLSTVIQVTGVGQL